jgi:hypothetical protein
MPVAVLSTLFPAVAEAVLSYALDKFDPADRVRSWLKLDPARLAYQKALARTYTAFARQYPELTATLFDESFLKREAAPDLAKQLTRHQSPDPAHLTALWAESFWSKLLPETPERQGQKQSLIKRHIQPASEFLRWLEAELKAEQVFGPLFDSRALESLPVIETRLGELTAELQRGFEAALNAARQYHAVITVDKNYGTIINGQGNTVTAVYNYYFANDFATLNDYYIPPDSVFQRVRVQDFVGREWLAAKVDAFLNDPARKSGAFVLVGEAGVGKTSFAAHLVRERRYLHLFAEQVPGEANLSRALQSLGAQLVSRYQIEPYKGRDTLTQLSTFPDFLDRLLRLAANTLAAGEKIVIVCDALDEAGTAPGGNVFGLPSVLPDGVYLLLTQRPVPTRLNFKFAPHNEKLDATSADNLHDVEAYLTTVARRPEIAGQLRARNYSEATFVRTLAGKSGGVWMYLYYVVQEIQAGSRAPLDLAKLPPGLAGYYGEYWGDWSEGRNGRGEGFAKWNALYAPLLATLAAAQEPVSVEQLVAWLGTSAASFEVQRLLKQSWRAFITEREGTYTLYHASLRDFITGDVARETLSVSGGYLVDELKDRTREAHNCILEYYRKQCDGDWPKLVDDDYARRRLAAHLAGAGRHEELFALVAQSNAWAEARYRKDESYAEYLIDLDLAWQWAEGAQTWNIGRQIRCALIESSLHSLAGNLSPELLFQVVEAGLWSAARALTHIPQIPDERQRAEALTKIGPLLPDSLKAEAMQAARAIMDEYGRARALSGLAPHLPEALIKAEVLLEALQAARAISVEQARAHALGDVAPGLPEALKAGVLLEALQAARAIMDEGWQADALSGLAPHLPDALKGEALQAARAIADEYARARALSGLTPHLPEALKAEVLLEALQAARAIPVEQARARALSGLAPHLPDALKAEALSEALQAARAIMDEGWRADALRDLAPRLPGAVQVETLSEALQALRAITDEEERADALNDLAPRLPDTLKAEALQAARAIANEDARARALSGLAPHLPDALKTKALSEALQATRAIVNEGARARALSGLAPHLPDTLKTEALSEALQATRAIADEDARARALSSLAPHLPDTLKTEALSEALQAARAITDEYRRARALSDLAPHLPDALKTEALSEALQAARAITDEEGQVHALHDLAPHLLDAVQVETLNEALQAARAIMDAGWRAIALGNLAPGLPEALKVGVLHEALQAARVITDEGWRADALRDLAPHLPDTLKAEALSEVLQAVRAITDEDARARALSGLALHLPDALKTEALSEALQAARAIADEYALARALSDLALHLPDALKTEALSEALQAARAITDEYIRAIFLSNLAPRLPDAFKAEALQIARAIANEYARADALRGLAPYLPGAVQVETLSEALQALRAITDEEERAHALSGLAPHLPDALKAGVLFEAFLAVRNVEEPFFDVAKRANLFTNILPPWKELGFVGLGDGRVLWPETLHTLARYRRAELLYDLSALLPLIEHLGGAGAVQETFLAMRDVARWWA